MFLILAPLFPAVRRMALDLVSPAEESYSLNKVSLGKTIARAEVEAETTKGEELERIQPKFGGQQQTTGKSSDVPRGVAET